MNLPQRPGDEASLNYAQTSQEKLKTPSCRYANPPL